MVVVVRCLIVFQGWAGQSHLDIKVVEVVQVVFAIRLRVRIKLSVEIDAVQVRIEAREIHRYEYVQKQGWHGIMLYTPGLLGDASDRFAHELDEFVPGDRDGVTRFVLGNDGGPREQTAGAYHCMGTRRLTANRVAVDTLLALPGCSFGFKARPALTMLPLRRLTKHRLVALSRSQILG